MNDIAQIRPPELALYLLEKLHRAGYEAYIVGGCVRDSLLGRTPGDWDICTSARPEEMETLFAGQRLLLKGKKHGTVAVVLDGKSWEMTTFRQDGHYTDGRHPDCVHFVPCLREDLARRDFTVNAMAWSPTEGLIDLFGGQQDLNDGILRCVGDPVARFDEDALRILRAVRFAAQLGFRLDPATADAALQARMSVRCVSAERIFTELDRLLEGFAAGTVLARYGHILTGALPEIEACIGCSQLGRWHCYDVWNHTAAAMGGLDTEGMDPRSARVLRWAVLLHDMAKPMCRIADEDGTAHFPGHNQRGARLARQILQRLRAPVYLIDGVVALVAVHDGPLPSSDLEILEQLHQRGPLFWQRLCRLKLADLAAHANNEAVAQRCQEVRQFARRMQHLSDTACYTVSGLAITGSDLIAAGLTPGPLVGNTLEWLLQAVMQGSLPNERAALLQAVRAQQNS